MGSWSSRRSELHERLKEIDPNLAEFYARAVDLLGDAPSPVRTHVLASLVRELVNHGAECLLGEDAELAGYRSSTQSQKDLRDAWTASGISLQAEVTGDILIPVPLAVARAAELVVADTDIAEGQAAARRTAFATGSPDGAKEGPAALIHQATSFFRKWWHFRGQDAPDEVDLQTNFEKVESVLRARVSSFFDTAEDLEQILLEANRREDSADGRDAEEQN